MLKFFLLNHVAPITKVIHENMITINNTGKTICPYKSHVNMTLVQTTIFWIFLTFTF